MRIGTYDLSNQVQSRGVNQSNGRDRTTLDMNDFMQLLATQLRYQDMSNPMDNSQMMQQLTQMATVTSMNTMTEMLTSVTEVSTIAYATSMIGKEITVVENIDSETGKITSVKGQVSGVGFYEGIPCVVIEGKAYTLSQIMSMGEVPEREN